MMEVDNDEVALRQKLVRWQVVTVILLYCGYLGTIVCRGDVGVVLPSMKIHLGEDSFNNKDAGTLLAVGNLAYIIGKIINGFVSDKFGGRWLFIISLAVAVVMTVAFGFVRVLWLFCLVWAINRFFQAAGWSAAAKVIHEFFAPAQYTRAFSILSTSPKLGGVLCGLVLGALLTLTTLEWYHVIFIAAGAAGVCLLSNILFLRSSAAAVGIPHRVVLGQTAAVAEKDSASIEPRPPFRQTMLRIVKEPRFWLICAAYACLTLVYEFESFTPLYLSDAFGVPARVAGIAAAASPGGSVVSLAVSGFLLPRLSLRWNAIVTLSLCMLTLPLLGLLMMVTTIPSMHNVSVAVVLVFFLGFSIAVPFFIPFSVFSMKFGGKHGNGTLVGLIGAAGYTAAMLFDLVSGHLSQDLGWVYVLAVLAGAAFLACVLMGAFLLLDVRAQEKAEQHQKLQEEDDGSEDVQELLGEPSHEARKSETEMRQL
eukprot:TRINITY_DN8354_c0_g1_i1.p1 TRINITY_DN8354_c0_g1~~TRINITY_DN8354_c0_g1_i1.p1  ORF type:complete len:480 (+),score=91.98 TRINITY_DN8354_c0_g1_i1:109-1548(+)